MISEEHANTIVESIVEELVELGWPTELDWPQFCQIAKLMLGPVTER